MTPLLIVWWIGFLVVAGLSVGIVAAIDTFHFRRLKTYEWYCMAILVAIILYSLYFTGFQQP